jgi:predicted kinase
MRVLKHALRIGDAPRRYDACVEKTRSIERVFVPLDKAVSDSEMVSRSKLVRELSSWLNSNGLTINKFMTLPILGKLKNGAKFDFCTLADNVDQTEDYWRWWWEEKAKPGEFGQPEIIENNDPILTRTIEKQTVNLSMNREFFDRTLFRMTEIGLIPAKNNLPREDFRNVVKKVCGNASVKLRGAPQLIFSGGGHGSGKTTLVNHLAERNVLPVGQSQLVGSDIFKQLIPEFNLIKAVGDGRAAETVHEESVKLTDELLKSLVEAGRSFIFDSSMAYKDHTLRRIKLAKKYGYVLTMIAVVTPAEKALQFALTRAKETRRFPRNASFITSHKAFLQVFRDYFEWFDEIKVFANLGEIEDIELVAEKKTGKPLEIANPDVFNSPPFVPL